MATRDYEPYPVVRSCCCVGYLTNPGGRCCMDLPRGQTYVTDKIVITPNDDPLSPQPSPMAGSWQCQGCGRIYNMTINHCDCQKRDMVTSGNSTNAKLDGKNGQFRL